MHFSAVYTMFTRGFWLESVRFKFFFLKFSAKVSIFIVAYYVIVKFTIK